MDSIFEDLLPSFNSALRDPQPLSFLLQPLQSRVFELDFVVPSSFESSILTLSLYLTNPAKNHEKFGDHMQVIFEILPTAPLVPDQVPDSPGSRLESSILIEEDQEEYKDPQLEKEEEDRMQASLNIQEQCQKAVSMIDDLFKQLDDDFQFGGPEADPEAFLPLSRESMYAPDEIRRLNEQAKEEVQSSQKRFEEIFKESLADLRGAKPE